MMAPVPATFLVIGLVVVVVVATSFVILDGGEFTVGLGCVFVEKVAVGEWGAAEAADFVVGQLSLGFHIRHTVRLHIAQLLL